MKSTPSRLVGREEATLALNLMAWSMSVSSIEAPYCLAPRLPFTVYMGLSIGWPPATIVRAPPSWCIFLINLLRADEQNVSDRMMISLAASGGAAVVVRLPYPKNDNAFRSLVIDDIKEILALDSSEKVNMIWIWFEEFAKRSEILLRRCIEIVCCSPIACGQDLIRRIYMELV